MYEGYRLQETIRHLNCMNASDFERVFGTGNMGENYYWEKFLSFDRNVGNFICYLDCANLAKLEAEMDRHIYGR